MAPEREPAYQKHTNEERMVKCPYCDDSVFSRGLYLHVYKNGDEQHGGPDAVPDDFEERKQDLEEVGTRSITMVVPTHKEYDHELVMCKWCGDTFKGTQGLGTHLGKIGSDGLHPADADVQTSGIRIPADEDHEPVWTAEIEDQLADEVEFDPDDLPDKLTYGTPPTEIDVTGSVPAKSLANLARNFERKAAEDDEPVWGLAAERVRALIEREA